jgi:hypothetical protein
MLIAASGGVCGWLQYFYQLRLVQGGGFLASKLGGWHNEHGRMAGTRGGGLA